MVSYISMKSRIGRKIFAGNPTVIIENGKIPENNMRKMRYSLNYLNQQLRENRIFNIEEVLYVVVETNGKISVLKTRISYCYKTRFKYTDKKRV